MTSPLRGGKGSGYEGGVRTPCIARWPAVIRNGGAISQAVGHVMDFMPTFLQAAGASYPSEFQGRPPLPSILHVDRGQRGFQPREIELPGEPDISLGDACNFDLAGLRQREDLEQMIGETQARQLMRHLAVGHRGAQVAVGELEAIAFAGGKIVFEIFAERGEAWHWTLRLKTDPDNLVGSIGLMKNEDDNRGFWIAPPWQGQGLMTEATEAVTDFWFDTLGFPVMRVQKAVANTASHRISEKNGMRLVATAERDYVCGRFPAEIWEITAEEWRAHRRVKRQRP